MISKTKQKGFTIVELLIVIVVIGILAAISIVAYNNVTQKARDDQRITDVRNIVNAFGSYQSENGKWATKTEIAVYKTVQLSQDQKDRLGDVAPGDAASANNNYQLNYCTNATKSTTYSDGATGVEVLYYKEADKTANNKISTGVCS